MFQFQYKSVNYFSRSSDGRLALVHGEQLAFYVLVHCLLKTGLPIPLWRGTKGQVVLSPAFICQRSHSQLVLSNHLFCTGKTLKWKYWDLWNFWKWYVEPEPPLSYCETTSVLGARWTLFIEQVKFLRWVTPSLQCGKQCPNNSFWFLSLYHYMVQAAWREVSCCGLCLLLCRRVEPVLRSVESQSHPNTIEPKYKIRQIPNTRYQKYQMTSISSRSGMSVPFCGNQACRELLFMKPVFSCVCRFSWLSTNGCLHTFGNKTSRS